MSWALQRIAELTLIPADKRGDAAFLRQAVMLAHVYAEAGLAGEATERALDAEGQVDLFAEL